MVLGLDGKVIGDVLPDSRLRTIVTPKGMVNGPGGTWIPVFCANCGADGGLCPEESTFLFYLCNPCFETHGHLTGTMVMPDEIFFEKLKQEQLATYGRYLTQDELRAIVAAGASPLATLLTQGR